MKSFRNHFCWVAMLLEHWGNAMVFYPRYGLILSNIQRNWFAISSDAWRARKVLQFNFEECWTVLIHTWDKRPSYSHCYQVNDCQVTCIKNILLLKGGQYFWIEKNTFLLLQVKIFLLTKGGTYFFSMQKYCPPFSNEIFLMHVT